jgi:hypothetical protein
MTTDDEPDYGGVPTVQCRVCQTAVPSGEFCGLCGVRLTRRRGDGPDWLRISAFGAAPGEHVLAPLPASSLFPQLARWSRAPFRVALVVVPVALIVFAVLRVPAASIGVAALGLPLLFLTYLQESDAIHDLPARTLVITVALGIGLGVAWVLLTGPAVARSYQIAPGAAMGASRMLRAGLGVPLGGVLVMLLPAVVVRLARPATREALDGFVVGALGALCFTAAATLARLAPEFQVGMVSKRPMASLLVEAGIRGVAAPVTASAAGGLIGAALWFTRPPSKAGQRAGLVRLAPVGFAVVVLAIYVGLGLIDVARLPQVPLLVAYLAVATLALVALRMGVHLALLHEAHDPIIGAPLLCENCGHVVPDMAFCPACGVATRASSRSSRTLRRETRPQRRDTDDT